MQSVLVNVVIGLVTSIISAGSVWLWQRASAAGNARRRKRFFGVAPGDDCLIVMGHHHSARGLMPRQDVYAVLELGALVEEVGGTATFEVGSDFRGGSGDRTEFCISGPTANRRSEAHLAQYLPGVTQRPYSDAPDSVALVVREQEYRWVRGEREHAVVARFTPRGQDSPVFLICGQTPKANRAGVSFLRRNYADLTRSLASVDQFCLIIGISDVHVYGHELVDLVADVTDAAFASAS